MSAGSISARFPDGGFVVHRMLNSGVGAGSSSYSGWFDQTGCLVDAELCHWVKGRRQSRQVCRGGGVWRRLEIEGRRYVLPSVPEPVPCVS